MILHMSTERKNPLKHDQALNDATNGQMGEEPRSVPVNKIYMLQKGVGEEKVAISNISR